MDGFQLRQGQNHFEEAVYFLPLSSQSFGIRWTPFTDTSRSEAAIRNYGKILKN